MITKFLHWIGKVSTGFLLLALILTGCNDDPVNNSLQFSDDNLLLKAAGDTVMINVTAGTDWKAESMAEWCIVEEKGENKLVIWVTPSDDIYERGTAVKVSCGNNIVRLSVRQEPMIFEISDGKKTLDFSKQVASDVLKIHTNMSWKVEITDTTGWLTVADTIGNGDAELVFTTTDNSQKKNRSTTVRLRYGIRTLKLTASQEGGIRANGHIQKHYGEREVEKGFNLVFLGDGFIEEDLVAETGAFDQAVEEACTALFSVEPYKTYKAYFNIWSIAYESQERGAGNDEGSVKNTVFQSFFQPSEEQNGEISSLLLPKAFEYTSKILGMTEEILKNNTVIVILVNDERYGGSTYWYSDGRTVSFIPLNRDEQLPGGFANLFLHEVGGHGIGKLGDEWSSDISFSPEDKTQVQNLQKNYYCCNLGLPNVAALGNYPSYWAPISNQKPEYSGVIKGIDGGFGRISNPSTKSFIYHTEEKSCMIDHLPYFNANSRFAIMWYVLFKLGEYEANARLSQARTDFLENDQFEIPGDYEVSNRPHLRMPLWIEAVEN